MVTVRILLVSGLVAVLCLLYGMPAQAVSVGDLVNFVSVIDDFEDGVTTVQGVGYSFEPAGAYESGGALVLPVRNFPPGIVAGFGGYGVADFNFATGTLNLSNYNGIEVDVEVTNIASGPTTLAVNIRDFTGGQTYYGWNAKPLVQGIQTVSFPFSGGAQFGLNPNNIRQLGMEVMGLTDGAPSFKIYEIRPTGGVTVSEAIQVLAQAILAGTGGLSEDEVNDLIDTKLGPVSADIDTIIGSYNAHTHDKGSGGRNTLAPVPQID